MTLNSKKLPSYQWEGINRSGQFTQGVIAAGNRKDAKAQLLTQGIFIRKILKKRTPLLDIRNRKIKQQDITLFSRQMSTLIEAGVPLLQSFETIIKGQTNHRIQALLERIKQNIESGATLAESLSQYPAFFNQLFCNLISVGEKSGSLDVMLNKIATYKEKMEHLKKKIKKALTYPMAVTAIAFLVTAALMIYVIPQFEALFKGFDAELPALTRSVITLSTWFQSYGVLIVFLFISSTYGLVYLHRYSLKLAQTVDTFILKVPIIGNLFALAAIARFSRTLSITFAAGLPLMDALTTVSGATGHVLYTKAIHRIKDCVSSGQPMHTAMASTALFPSMVIQMVAIGEESGTLELMLSKIAHFYENEVDNAVDVLSRLLEPLIMAILGIIVGILVVAMYLPLFKLGSVV